MTDITVNFDGSVSLQSHPKWMCVEEYGFVHILPINDICKHDYEFCLCDPRIEMDGRLIIHNSFDGREYLETGQCS